MEYQTLETKTAPTCSLMQIAEKTPTLREIFHGLNQTADDKVVFEVVLAQRDGEYK
jgi:hypothetical protein